MDFSPENLPDLKSTIEKLYFDVKVSTIHADAADDAAISGVCEQALKEEGRLDVFFANVRRSQASIARNYILCYVSRLVFHSNNHWKQQLPHSLWRS
jgi:hypothetical protein